MSTTGDDFSDRDLEQLQTHGIEQTEAKRYLALLRQPFAAIRLSRPCSAEDEIRQLDEADALRLESGGRQAARDGRIMKFVPASGAATRMFNDLAAAIDGPQTRAVERFFDALDQYPFVEELRETLQRNGIDPGDRSGTLKALLHTGGLAYSSRAKAFIVFHRHPSGPRTAFEEQLRESVYYARDAHGDVRIHFTVAAEHLRQFQEQLRRIIERVEAETKSRLIVSFSIQHPSTDTLAIDSEGRVARNADGSLLFRPGGHGALIRNLQETGGDLVVVKNIDNILPAERQGEAARWKQVLIGLLAELQSQAHDHLRRVRSQSASTEEVRAAAQFLEEELAIRPDSPENAADSENLRQQLIERLDRPWRVCGVVRNEGEPGGAPFQVCDDDGHSSVQIVESSQVDMSDDGQAQIWKAATHFNPVDLVCGLRDAEGSGHVLSRFVDTDAVFVSPKFHDGREVKALELPGLWNGGMAGWNTVLVEVPASTFAPVKTVFDLLRPEHQPK
ncbi:MAG: DUF4301 family protein [Acidobacteriota bacterium]